MANLCGRPVYAKAQKPQKSLPIRNASRGQECTFQIPGVCSCDPDKTVGAHFRAPWLCGAAQKPDDLFIMDACDTCHAVQEAYGWRTLDAPLGAEDVLRALTITQMRRRASGLIVLA